MRLVFGMFCTLSLSGAWLVQNGGHDRTATSTLAVAQAEPVNAARIDYKGSRRPVITLPDGQTRVIQSVLNIRRQFKFGEFIWNDTGVANGPVWVRVDLERQTLSAFRSGHEIGTTVILFGAKSNPTPSGVFPVLEKARTHRSSLYDADMPFMMRLTNDGVAIHASSVRQGSATHGCIGVPLEFARLLFHELQVGDQVAIIAA